MSFITVLSVINALQTIKPGYFSMSNLQQFIFVANIIIIVVLSAKKLIFYLWMFPNAVFLFVLFSESIFILADLSC
jgi:hypothetical protein